MSVISDTVSQDWVRRVNRDLALLKRHRHGGSVSPAVSVAPEDDVADVTEEVAPEAVEETIVAPVVPSAPMTTTTMASVTVAWDGYGAGGEAMPPNFAYVVIHRSPDGPDFEPEVFTQAAVLQTEGAVTFADQPYDVPTYYRLVMHTTSGDTSAPSDSTVGVAVQVATTDVAFSALDIDDGTILAAMDAANGKNQIIHATTTPSAPGNTNGDVWFQRDAGTGIVTGQWEWDGDSWESRILASAVIANLDAGKITTGELSAGVRIIAGPESGTHAELTSTGFKAFIEDPVDLVPNESVRIGTDTNDLFALSDATGAIKATISDEGKASFAGASVDSDPTIMGYPLVGSLGASLYDIVSFWDDATYGRDPETDPIGIIEQYAKGAVAWEQFDCSAFSGNVAAGQERALFEIGYDMEPGRQYTFRMAPMLITVNAGATALLRLRATVDGSIPNLTSPVFAFDYNQSSTAVNISCCIPQRLVNGGSTGQTQVRFLLCLAGQGGNVAVYASQSCEVSIDDLGPTKVRTGTVRNFLNTGSPSAVPVKKTYTKTYASTASGTYRNTGFKRTDTTDVVQGYNSFNGDGEGLWIFPTSIATDLAGATVNKIEVYAYANHWYYNSGGTALIKVHGYTSAPASSPSQTTCKSVAGWPKPGGKWVTLPSSVYAGFKAGTYRGFGMGPSGGSNLLYYGRFNGGTGARIRTTYTK